MFLRKIEISGFKSFREKTILEFDGDFLIDKKNKSLQLTVIAGPNGSGKSNIVDAFSWVLGEQSMKNLRTDRGEDLIFAGSNKKARLGMAMVVLYFDNASKRLPIDYREIKIARKLYRDGESEYFLNDSKVRLLDIWQLLSGAGLGKKGYSIVGQGLVDKILNANSSDRLEVLEEAVGIKEFQIKKERSQRKLRASNLNLERVALVIKELEPRFLQLKNEMEKFLRFKELKQSLDNHRNQLIMSLYGEGLRELERIDERLKKEQEAKSHLERELKEVKGQLLKDKKTAITKSNRMIFLQGRIRDWQRRISEVEKEKVILEGKVEIALDKKKLVEKFERKPADTFFVIDALGGLKRKQIKLANLIESFSSESDKKTLKNLAKELVDELTELRQFVQKGSFEKELSDKDFQLKQSVFDDEISQSKVLREKLDREAKKLEEKVDDAWKELADLQKNEGNQQKESFDFERKKRELEFDWDMIVQKIDELKIELSLCTRRLNEFKKKLGEQVSEKNAISWSKNHSSVQLEKELTRIEIQIEQLGQVDELAEQEYNELKERLAFFRVQSDDLKTSIAKLTKSIQDFDAKIQKLFNVAFPKIATNFQKYIQLIFKGGSAKIEKVFNQEELERASVETDSLARDCEDGACRGIDLRVCLPDKKVSGLHSLSGGERSLVSLAFLFALISHNPPPLVILDEVEAALDEANTAKFIEIIKNLSAKTQFIIITHNRETMRSAKLLYGIYMQKDGTSKIVSLDLSQRNE